MGIAVSGLSALVRSSNMIDCVGMDKEQPALCHMHAENTYAKQSLDKPQVPVVQPFVFTGLTLTLDLIYVDGIQGTQQEYPLYLTRSTSPPISIRNCCFRI